MPLRVLLFGCIVLLLSACNGYEKDNNHVYYKSWNEGNGTSKVVIKDADPRSFKELSRGYAKDRFRVYYNGQPIDGADPASFEVLADFRARDKNSGYDEADRVIDSRGATYQIIDSYYSKDDSDIFYTTKPLHVCSVKDFRFITKGNKYDRWATDGRYYYFNEFKVPSNDYGNMHLFEGSGGISKDREHVYFMGRSIMYNDSGQRILDTVDVESFTATGFISCHDKFGPISVSHGRKVPKNTVSKRDIGKWGMN